MDFRAVLITLAIFVAVVVCADSDDREAEGKFTVRHVEREKPEDLGRAYLILLTQ